MDDILQAEIQAKKDEMDNDDENFFDKDDYDAAYALIYAKYGKTYVVPKKRKDRDKDRDDITKSKISKVPFDLERIHSLLGPQSIIRIPIDNSIFGDISTYNSQLTVTQHFHRDDKEDAIVFAGEHHVKNKILQQYINQINAKIQPQLVIKSGLVRMYTQIMESSTKFTGSVLGPTYHREFQKPTFTHSYIGFYTLSIQNCESQCSTRILYQIADNTFETTYLPTDNNLYLINDCQFMHSSPIFTKIDPNDPIIRNLVVCEFTFFDIPWTPHCINPDNYKLMNFLNDTPNGGFRKSRRVKSRKNKSRIVKSRRVKNKSKKNKSRKSRR
jgi:hypothetical protein